MLHYRFTALGTIAVTRVDFHLEGIRFETGRLSAILTYVLIVFVSRSK
jgi:hypothetical protein